MISNNEMKELPVSMSEFRVLSKLDVSDNVFSSNHQGKQLWFTLASIPNLKVLNISKNQLRGRNKKKLIKNGLF